MNKLTMTTLIECILSEMTMLEKYFNDSGVHQMEDKSKGM